MFDRFSIDFQGLGKDWRSIGGPLEEHWRAGGGSQGGWRRTGEGLEEDWRRIGGGWTPEVWPGYAPVWGLDRDLLKKRPKFAKNVTNSSKLRFGGDFSFRALKLLANHETQLLTFFGFLPPYFGVSRSLALFLKLNMTRRIDWYHQFFISCRLARFRNFR